MTDELAEIRLKQLILAIEYLAQSWEIIEIEYYKQLKYKRTEDEATTVKLYKAYSQITSTLRQIYVLVRFLPEDASEEDIKNMVNKASADTDEF